MSFSFKDSQITFEEYKDLKQRGSLCTYVKELILAKCFKTDVQIRDFVLELCKQRGYKESFPTMVMTGDSVANAIPNREYPVFLDQYPMYTVDFGFNSDKGYPCDNSCSYTEDEQLSEYLDSYKSQIAQIINTLNVSYLQKGFLKTYQIAELVQKVFNRGSHSMMVIPYCDGHTIGKDFLHQKSIPMCYTTRQQYDQLYKTDEAQCTLGPGTVFTIEPHVLILDPKFFYCNDKTKGLSSISVWDEHSKLKGVCIRKDKRGHPKMEYYLEAEIPYKYNEHEMYSLPKTKANRASFFIEDTYVLTDRIQKIT